MSDEFNGNEEAPKKRTRKPSKQYLVARLPEGVSIDDVEILALTTKADVAMGTMQENPGSIFRVL